MKRKTCILLSVLLALCALLGLVACQKGRGDGRVLTYNERTLAICVDTVEGDATLIDVMKELREKGDIDFKIVGGMVTEINGVSNAADFSGCWMLYTTDGDMANSDWGKMEYEGKTLGSAIVGAEALVVEVGEIYVWSYQSF